MVDFKAKTSLIAYSYRSPSFRIFTSYYLTCIRNPCPGHIRPVHHVGWWPFHPIRLHGVRIHPPSAALQLRTLAEEAPKLTPGEVGHPGGIPESNRCLNLIEAAVGWFHLPSWSQGDIGPGGRVSRKRWCRMGWSLPHPLPRCQWLAGTDRALAVVAHQTKPGKFV